MPEHRLSKLGESPAMRLSDAERQEMRQTMLQKIHGKESVSHGSGERLSGDMELTKSLIIGLKDQTSLFLDREEKSAMFQALRAKTREAAEIPPTPFFSVNLLKLAGAFGVFLLGATGAAAAEFSLPGHALYPVKIHVNENVRASLSFTTASRASWNIERTKRRLVEAEALAERSELTPALAADIGTRVTAEASVAERSIAQVRHEGKVAASLELSNRFRESLQKREEALKNVIEHNASSRPAVERLLLSVSALTDTETPEEPQQGAATDTRGTLSVPPAAVKTSGHAEAVLRVGSSSSAGTERSSSSAAPHTEATVNGGVFLSSSSVSADVDVSADAKAKTHSPVPAVSPQASQTASSASSDAASSPSSVSATSSSAVSSSSISSSDALLPPDVKDTVKDLLGH